MEWRKRPTPEWFYHHSGLLCDSLVDPKQHLMDMALLQVIAVWLNCATLGRIESTTLFKKDFDNVATGH